MESVAIVLIGVGLSVGLGSLIVLHLLPTGLSPVRNAVSQYGIARFKVGYRVQTIAYAVAGIGAAVGIASLPRPSALVVALCCVFAVSRAAISWFPMDSPGASHTETGRRHGLLAACAFVGILIAAGGLSKMLEHAHVDGAYGATSAALGLVMLAALFGMRLDRRAGGRHYGLIERGFYLGMTAWLVVVALLLASA